MTTRDHYQLRSSSRFDLDFTQLPLTAGVDLLQRLGRNLLQQVLAAEETPPVLSRLLGNADLRLLRPATLWTLRRHARARGYKQPLWRLVQTRLASLYHHLRRRPPGYEYQATMQLAAQGRLPRWGVRMRALSEIERRMGGVGPEAVSPDWWPILGERAWLDSAFQHEMAGLIHAHLRQETLFAVGQMPRPRLAPRTFWLLIALAEPTRLRFWQWLRPDRRRLRQGIDQLQRLAQSQIAQPQWAEFWDQWTAVEALRCWPQSARRLPPTLRRSLATLPLLGELPADLLTGPIRTDMGGEAIDLAHPSWREYLPTWLPVYYRSLIEET